ncbi:granzyme B-like [Solea senegalensis]|uniref:Granzyme B-like n=1 Tax=Solea senegalensis TaxID=28829 RepID=A0AAV6RJ82_SOLSE|nr:mast cell protease 4-like [Solea senegalensis]KAG7504076.1 granzyme B-like [Solea senegalensis]
MMQIFCIIFVLYFFTPAGGSEVGIVHGTISTPHSRPYMASLQFSKKHTCGGILIREDFVLTAAHCKKTQDMTVVLGAHNINKREKSQQRIKVAAYHSHPKFTGEYDHDIMLLKLKKKAKLNKYVRAIELPEKDNEIHANVPCVVAGWGQTGFQEPYSKLLRETTEKTQSSFECKTIWKEHFNNDRMICTTFDKKKGGVCQGDSGGPLICDGKPQGITAYTAQDCSDTRYPHVFTKIQFFLPWIKKVMQGNRNVE